MNKKTKLSDKDILQLETILEQSRTILVWWFDFCYNIFKQGWISDKQRLKLEKINYEKAINRTYGVSKRGRTKRTDWSSGLDHDEISDYTGESCAAEFFS